MIIKTYKNEQSYFNQQGYFRLCTNQVRPNKETSKFTRIKTSNVYHSLIDEMKDLNEYEYICAGLNSFQRELVVIDSDDTSYGKNAIEKLNKDNLTPHFQKIKLNGHSQTYFFIEKFYIGSAGYKNGKYWEKDNVINHEQWKRLTKMINYLYAGDICYTGYNCQNPFYKKANVTEYKNVQELYTVQELYDKCIEKFSDIDNIDNYLSILRKRALLLKPKQHEKINNVNKVVIKYKEDMNTTNSIKTNVTQLAEYVLDETDDVIKSINERIFILTCQVAKSFKNHNKLNWKHFEEIAKTTYQNFVYQDYAKGYTSQELINRIRADVRQIIIKDKYNQINWSKVGYTKKQREHSLEVRRQHKQDRIDIINEKYISIIKDNKLSKRKKADYITSDWNIHHEHDKISSRTIIRYIDEINNKKEIGNTNMSIKTNVTDYVESLVNKVINTNIKGDYNYGNGILVRRKEIGLLSS